MSFNGHHCDKPRVGIRSPQRRWLLSNQARLLPQPNGGGSDVPNRCTPPKSNQTSSGSARSARMRSDQGKRLPHTAYDNRSIAGPRAKAPNVGTPRPQSMSRVHARCRHHLSPDGAGADKDTRVHLRVVFDGSSLLQCKRTLMLLC